MTSEKQNKALTRLVVRSLFIRSDTHHGNSPSRVGALFLEGVKTMTIQERKDLLGLTPIVDDAMRTACEAMAALPEINFRDCAVGNAIRLARAALDLAKGEANAGGYVGLTIGPS